MTPANERQLIAEGSAKLSSVPSGGAAVASSGAAAAAGGAAPAAGGAPAAAGGAAEEAPKEEAKEEAKEESDDDMVRLVCVCYTRIVLTIGIVGLRSLRLNVITRAILLLILHHCAVANFPSLEMCFLCIFCCGVDCTCVRFEAGLRLRSHIFFVL